MEVDIHLEDVAEMEVVIHQDLVVLEKDIPPQGKVGQAADIPTVETDQLIQDIKMVF
jgi:hypothetical protein